MNRRGFFATFAGLLAAIPFIGKLAPKPTESACGSITITYRVGKNGCYRVTKIDQEPITDEAGRDESWHWSTQDKNGNWIRADTAWEALRKRTERDEA